MTAGTWRLPPPDDQRPSFLAHAIALTAAHGPGPLPDGGYPLPDDDGAHERPFMSGAVRDGVRAHHFGFDPDVPAAERIAGVLDELVTSAPTAAALQHLHDAAADLDLLPVADALTDELAAREPDAERLRQVARRLAEYGTRRNAVALGILLLGLAGDARDRELLLLLGSLVDLSLYAAVALNRSQPDRDRALFDLARRVEGWGRIHAVRRLAGTQDPEIKAWLLRDGFRNAILDEYLAHIAATTGDLYGALMTPPVDDALLDAAGDILTALYLGGPAEDVTDYPDALPATDRYLTLVAGRPPRLARVTVVLRLTRLLASDQAIGEEWTAETRTRLQRACDALVARPAWRRTVEHALDAADPAGFRTAIWPARRLGIPTQDRIRSRLRTDPDDAYLWQELTRDIDDALDLAQELLPLDDLADGPIPELGLDDDAPHQILDVLVSRLADHPGRGWPLIQAALANRTIRNRNMACHALESWPPDTVTLPIIEAVRQALPIEPDTGIRDRMSKLLATWTGVAPAQPSERAAERCDPDRWG